MHDDLVSRVLHGCLPWLLWSLHFFAMYLLAALGVNRWLLLVLTLAAIAGCLLLLRGAVATLKQSGAALHQWAKAFNAVLAALAIGWTSLPFALLESMRGLL